MPGGWEWAILVLIALLLFGGSRLSGIGRNVGRAVREFKEQSSPQMVSAPVPASEPADDAPAIREVIPAQPTSDTRPSGTEAGPTDLEVVDAELVEPPSSSDPEQV
jgi:sec-independent protein translocase protein TatA